jgi:hypothetical protein
VEVVSASGIAGSGLEWSNPFENLFDSNVALIITWIIFIKCLYRYLNKPSQNRDSKSGNKE